MIELEPTMYDEILEQALAEFPNEACGLVAGKEGRPVKLFRMKNADASPVTYRLDTDEQYAVYRECLDQDWDTEPYAIYHSHTHSQAYPSETDIDKALYPESRYLILSLEDRERPVLRGFRIVSGDVTEEEVSIG
ncbi:MAG: M67 family metallopeptidase [Actinomycetota bacterium]